MLASSIPTKIILPFANNAGGAYINVVPVASQIGITNGAASFYDGFPPNCFVALAAGGAGPFGKDFNGLLNVMSAWERWYCAGAAVAYDATFQTAIGGYPNGALVWSATTPFLQWLSLVDNNVTNPDTGGSGWLAYQPLVRGWKSGLAINTTLGNTTFGIAPGIIADNRGVGTRFGERRARYGNNRRQFILCAFYDAETKHRRSRCNSNKSNSRRCSIADSPFRLGICRTHWLCDD